MNNYILFVFFIRIPKKLFKCANVTLDDVTREDNLLILNES